MQNLFIFLFIYVLSVFKLNSDSQNITHCGVSIEDNTNAVSYVPTAFISTDTTLTYASPTLQQTPAGDNMLIWSEKSPNGNNALCFAIANKGGDFNNKKIIAQNTGLGNGRFSKAKVLFRKNGDWVAVFSQRFENPPIGKPAGRGPAGIVFSKSSDKGNTWSEPIFVDTDPNSKLLRGFFDAAIMPNDELAVAYLKDVAGSTKHEERNLRLVITEKMVPQTEQIIDDVACDCCPVNMVINTKGELEIMYRDNNNDIRDMAILTSKNNGKSFAASRILSPDNWKIAGCPHSGAVTFHSGKASLWAWQAGSEKEPGLRLVDAKGKKLFINSDASAKSPSLAGQNDTQVLAWEQTNNGQNQIAYKIIKGDKISDTKWLTGSDNATGVSTHLQGKELYFTYEVKMANKKNQLKVDKVEI